MPVTSAFAMHACTNAPAARVYSGLSGALYYAEEVIIEAVHHVEEAAIHLAHNAEECLEAVASTAAHIVEEAAEEFEHEVEMVFSQDCKFFFISSILTMLCIPYMRIGHHCLYLYIEYSNSLAYIKV